MRYLLGCTFFMFFASCRSTSREVPQTQDENNREKLAGAPISVSALPMRVGLEYLPPESASRKLPWNLRPPAEHNWGSNPSPLPSPFAERRRVSVVSLRPAQPEEPLTRSSDLIGQFEQALSVDQDEIDAIEDPVERMTMLFVRDLVGKDRRRLTRKLGTSVLTRRMLRNDDTSMLHNRFRELEDEQEANFLEAKGRSLLRSPLRKLIKKNTFIGDIKGMLDGFTADDAPLSGSYQEEEEPERWGWGSLSMHLRGGNRADPLELSYRNWGWKIGSSQKRARLSYSIDLTDNLQAGMRTRYDYDANKTQIQADLQYTINEHAHLYLVMADKLDYLSGPTASSFMSSPMDGKGGVLFYVEHRF